MCVATFAPVHLPMKKNVLPDAVAEKYDDDAEEEPPEIDDVVRTQCVTLEDYDHTEYDYY